MRINILDVSQMKDYPKYAFLSMSVRSTGLRRGDLIYNSNFSSYNMEYSLHNRIIWHEVLVFLENNVSVQCQLKGYQIYVSPNNH